MAQFNLRPDSIGTHDQWTLSTGSTKPSAVDAGDDIVHDDDTSRLTVSGNLYAQSFYLKSRPTMASVSVVTYNGHGKKNSTDPSHQGGQRDDAGFHWNAGLNGAYSSFSYLTRYVSDPTPDVTGGEINQADCQIWARHHTSGVLCLITSMWLAVTGVPVAGGFVTWLMSVIGVPTLVDMLQFSQLVQRSGTTFDKEEMKKYWSEWKELGHSVSYQFQ